MARTLGSQPAHDEDLHRHLERSPRRSRETAGTTVDPRELMHIAWAWGRPAASLWGCKETIDASRSLAERGDPMS